MNRRAAEKGTLSVTATRDLPGLAISGEIDEITYGELVAVLERFAEGQDESMSASRGVEYCDIAGLRAIVTLASTGTARRTAALE